MTVLKQHYISFVFIQFLKCADPIKNSCLSLQQRKIFKNTAFIFTHSAEDAASTKS